MSSKLHDISNYMMSTQTAVIEKGLDSEGYYNCIECLTPSMTLFRQISQSSPSSIKLTKCLVCRNDVDHYIEREWILVLLDVLLHRLSANRHLYLHRMRRDMTSRRNTAGKASMSSFVTTRHIEGLGFFSLFSLHDSYVFYIFFSLVITLLDVYLKYQANASPSFDIQPIQITMLIILSFIQLWVQVLFILLLSSQVILSVSQRLLKQNSKRFAVTCVLRHKIFNCLSIPLFYIKFLVSSILIWENSSVVRALGVLLTFSQQYLSLFCIIEHEIVMGIFSNWVMEQQKLSLHTVEDLSYWVNIFLKKNLSQSETSLLKRGFLLSNTRTVSAMCLLSLGASIILQSTVSIILLRFSNLPLLCSGFYVPLHRENSRGFLLCIG
jgi:hypothetical protein